MSRKKSEPQCLLHPHSTGRSVKADREARTEIIAKDAAETKEERIRIPRFKNHDSVVTIVWVKTICAQSKIRRKTIQRPTDTWRINNICVCVWVGGAWGGTFFVSPPRIYFITGRPTPPRHTLLPFLELGVHGGDKT